jgi:hypothetical protein
MPIVPKLSEPGSGTGKISTLPVLEKESFAERVTLSVADSEVPDKGPKLEAVLFGQTTVSGNPATSVQVPLRSTPISVPNGAMPLSCESSKYEIEAPSFPTSVRVTPREEVAKLYSADTTAVEKVKVADSGALVRFTRPTTKVTNGSGFRIAETESL